MIIALNGITGRSNAVQFTDSVRSLESYFKNQVNSLFTGVNGVGAGDDENQINIGFVAKFNDNSDIVNIYKIRGARLDSWTGNRSRDIYDSVSALNSSGDDIVYHETEYQMEWGNQFVYGQNLGGSLNANNRSHHFGVIRNPNGQDVMSFMILDSGFSGDLNNPQTYNPSSSYFRTNTVSGHFCVKAPSGQVAELEFASGRADFNFEANFNITALPCTAF